MLFTIEGLLTLLMIYVALTTLYNLRTMIRLPASARLPLVHPLISVLIPARNEACNIAACLEAVLAQDYRQMEVLVLDDGSSDGTAEIVREFAGRNPHLHLLEGVPLPEGWQGKSWACHQLYQRSQGDWLLFLDADTRPQANAVSSALSTSWHHKLDLLSLIPDMQLYTFGLRVLMALVPFVLVGWVPHDLFTNNTNPFYAVAYGPFMFLRRTMYQRTGGHQAISNDIADDVGLARLFKRAGGRVVLGDGVDILRVACYPDFVAAWRGMAKSMYPVFNYRLGYILLAMLFVTLIYCSPYLLISNAVWTGSYNMAGFWLPLCQVMLASGVMGLITSRYRIPLWHAPLYLLTVLVGVGFCGDSVLTHVLGPGTVWKGRVYRFGSK